MSRSKSSRQWLTEHFSDTFVKRAQKANVRARSFFKLEEIQNHYKIIGPQSKVVDLGAAPGSWSEFAAKLIGPQGKIFAVDLLPIIPIPRVEFIQGDFTKDEIVNALLQKIGADKIDVVISDMAPNASGIPEVDQLRAIVLCEKALEFSQKVLKKGGSLLIKTFQGQGWQEFLQSLKKNFSVVKTIKPEASRARSREVYILAQDFKSPG